MLSLRSGLRPLHTAYGTPDVIKRWHVHTSAAGKGQQGCAREHQSGHWEDDLLDLAMICWYITEHLASSSSINLRFSQSPLMWNYISEFNAMNAEKLRSFGKKGEINVERQGKHPDQRCWWSEEWFWENNFYLLQSCTTIKPLLLDCPYANHAHKLLLISTFRSIYRGSWYLPMPL